jgi:hypothetical protein
MASNAFVFLFLFFSFSWCKTQRQRYKNTMAIYQGLYGVELTCPQKKAKELYEKAKDKAKEVKATAASSGDGGKQSLTATPTLSDIGEAKNMMDPERICKLNAVGFEWELQKDTYVESWENRYNQLLKFKVINGHCRVPKSSGDNPQLGQWVKQVGHSEKSEWWNLLLVCNWGSTLFFCMLLTISFFDSSTLRGV